MKNLRKCVHDSDMPRHTHACRLFLLLYLSIYVQFIHPFAFVSEPANIATRRL
jgi:hypothetical protein